MLLFYDTETTGLPQWKGSHTDPKQPDVIQLGAILANEDGSVIQEFETLVNPSAYSPNWSMNPFAEAAHGISKEIVLENGRCGLEAFSDFLALTKDVSLAICHNVSFDRLLVQVALTRQDRISELTEFERLPTYCTMTTSTPLCKLKNKRGGAKWPKLDELHRFLFEETFEGAHDALNDVRATMRCYFELKERGY